MRIKTIHVYTLGDPAVGVGEEGATIEASGDFIIDLEGYDPVERSSLLFSFKTRIRTAFAQIWDGKIHVDFEYSDDNQEKQNDIVEDRVV